MNSGPRMVVIGTLLGSVFLSLFLAGITAGISYASDAHESSISVSAGRSSNNQAEAPEQPESDGRSSISEMISNTACIVSDQFPDDILQWCDLISQYSDQHRLDPDLIAALIWQESGGRHLAYSRSGAVGLMQVMPRDGLAATFMCQNGPCFSKRPTINELEDPEFNVSFGTKMLASLVNRNGKIRDALKSYGPMDVGYSYADKVLSIYNKYGKEG